MNMKSVYIVDPLRTPVGKYGGALKGVRPDDLAADVVRELVQRSGIDPSHIDDVIIGCANQAGEDNRNIARMASLLAGLPHTVPGVTVNRLCASSLEAIIQAARAIRSHEAHVVIAGGVESMTRSPYVFGKASESWSREAPKVYDTSLGWRFENPKMAERFELQSMGMTAENVAARWGITREEQDQFALHSHQKAAAAASGGGGSK
jgi:acetyl-CoA acetyltransferase family protein